METAHQREQREARERKKERQRVREELEAYRKRRFTRFLIDKKELLSLLKDAGLCPDDATRIIATGHRPDELSVTVTYD